MNTAAKKALEAHKMVSKGLPWETVVIQLGYANTKSAQEAVRTYSQRHGWGWPPKKKVSRRSQGRPLLGFNSHPEAAYRLRETGLLWSEVGAKMNLLTENAHRIAQRNARKYADRNNLPWPPALPKKDLPLPPGGEDAYSLRQKGYSWVDIGKKTGLDKKARGRAQKYAELANKTWPVDTNEDSQMEQSYLLRVENPTLSWKLIAEGVGYSHPNHACTGASRYWSSLAVEDLTQGNPHTTKISSRCGVLKAGQEITLIPVEDPSEIDMGTIALLDLNGNVILKPLTSNYGDGTFGVGGSKRSKRTSRVTLDQILGIVE